MAIHEPFNEVKKVYTPMYDFVNQCFTQHISHMIISGYTIKYVEVDDPDSLDYKLGIRIKHHS